MQVRAWIFQVVLMLVCLAALSAPRAGADEPPSRPAVDSPELARLGTFKVGVRTLTLVDRAAVDVVAPRQDRRIVVDLWYPATVPAGARPETYRASLPSEPPDPPVSFTVPGLAVRDARAVAGHYPLVILSHGRSNATIALSWLTENLASKGYVVAAIRHEDLPRTDPREGPEMFLRRPLDVAFVARSLQASLTLEGLIDPARTALIGYSMGGYGVLIDAGAGLDPQGGACKMVPDGLLLPYAQGGNQHESVQVRNLRAVVAIAPWGGSVSAWGPRGLAGISVPLLLIAGDRDHTVEYATGARSILEATTGARRYLLTYKGAGHALGFGPAPAEMRRRVWDISWFEDPVWRKERIIGINLHMITAFLDRFVKGDESRASYLDALETEAGAGHWQAPAGTPYGAVSPGTAGVTLWKGFQRDYAEGLELLQRTPTTLAPPSQAAP